MEECTALFANVEVKNKVLPCHPHVQQCPEPPGCPCFDLLNVWNDVEDTIAR